MLHDEYTSVVASFMPEFETSNHIQAIKIIREVSILEGKQREHPTKKKQEDIDRLKRRVISLLNNNLKINE